MNSEFEKDIETLLQKHNIKNSVFIGQYGNGNIGNHLTTEGFEGFNVIYTHLHLMLRQMENQYRAQVGSPKANLHVIKGD